MMRATGCFQSNKAGRLSGKERQHLPASELFAKHHIPRGTRPMRLENLFDERSPFKWFLATRFSHIAAVGGHPIAARLVLRRIRSIATTERHRFHH
jgi:hypothetical protein